MHMCIYVYVVPQNTNKKKKGHQLKRPSTAPSTAPLPPLYGPPEKLYRPSS